MSLADSKHTVTSINEQTSSLASFTQRNICAAPRSQVHPETSSLGPQHSGCTCLAQDSMGKLNCVVSPARGLMALLRHSRPARGQGSYETPCAMMGWSEVTTERKDSSTALLRLSRPCLPESSKTCRRDPALILLEKVCSSRVGLSPAWQVVLGLKT